MGSWLCVWAVVDQCVAKGNNWLGEIKSNRVVFYEGNRYRLDELVGKLSSEGSFSDIILAANCSRRVKTFLCLKSAMFQ